MLLPIWFSSDLSQTFNEDIGYYGGIQAIIFLGNLKTNRGTVKFLHGSEWKNCKMCNNLKTVDRQAKQMKVWDSWSYEPNM